MCLCLQGVKKVGAAAEGIPDLEDRELFSSMLRAPLHLLFPFTGIPELALLLLRHISDGCCFQYSK